MRAAEMARRTPPTRDRYVDFLRAFSIATVVVGHWFIALIDRDGGRIGVRSAIGATSGLWLGTWVLQVMPIFFFVGGFSNLVAYTAAVRRGEPYRTFIRARAARLLKPTAVFVAVWLPLEIALHITDRGGAGLIRLSFLPFGPLWFLLVYLAVIAATPAMLGLHRRYGAWVPPALIALAAVADLLRFGAAVPGVGWANLAVVWLFAHQLGFFYADGTLAGASRRALVGLAGAGLAGLVVLTNVGTYPRSMIGTDVERISNMNPPTLCIVALTLWQVGLAMLVRERVRRWLAGVRPWTAVVAANGIIMTVYLWHLTAYLLAVLALWPLGLGRRQDTVTAWWLERPLWIAAPGALLGVLVLLLGRFERPAPSPRP